MNYIFVVKISTFFGLYTAKYRKSCLFCHPFEIIPFRQIVFCVKKQFLSCKEYFFIRNKSHFVELSFSLSDKHYFFLVTEDRNHFLSCDKHFFNIKIILFCHFFRKNINVCVSIFLQKQFSSSESLRAKSGLQISSECLQPVAHHHILPCLVRPVRCKPM